MTPKLKSIFLIIAIFKKMQYKFKNKVVIEVLQKFIIVITNLLICNLIIKVSYIRSLLNIKLILIGLKLEILKNISYTYYNSIKPKRKIRPN